MPSVLLEPNPICGIRFPVIKNEIKNQNLGKIEKNKFENHSDLPSYTTISKNLSHDLKTRGFTFVGPTICYALMQAVGMVNDHIVDCFRYSKL